MQNKEIQGVSGFTADSFAPWMKNIVNDNNYIALSDGLKTISAFASKYNINNTLLNYYFGDLLDKTAVLKKDLVE